MLLHDFVKVESVVILHNLNMNILNVSCPYVNSNEMILRSLHFLPMITKPTRFPSGLMTGTSLDHAWTNKFGGSLADILCMDIFGSMSYNFVPKINTIFI